MAGTHVPGFHPQLPGFKYTFVAKGLGAVMWFFIFYRARQQERWRKVTGQASLGQPWRTRFTPLIDKSIQNESSANHAVAVKLLTRMFRCYVSIIRIGSCMNLSLGSETWSWSTFPFATAKSLVNAKKGLSHAEAIRISLYVMNYRVVNGLRIVWVIVTLWYELGVFFKSVSSCSWPDAVLQLSPYVANTPSHVLLIADPQILDHHSYPERGPFLTYLSRLVVDLNLRKAWWVALRKRPDAVVFLGDMMDGGRIDITDDEYEDYYQRFKDIFRLPLEIPTYFIPGNHDIGLRASPLFSPHARSRYRSHFGPLNSRMRVANHTFVLLDAPSFVEEDEQRVNSGHAYQDWTPRSGGPIEFVTTVAQESQNRPIVLMSHIPLARSSFDCGPLRERGTIRPGAALGYQNTLGKEATAFLLETLHPLVIFSGDDHDYCENYHTSSREGAIARVREVSVKSLSMAMGIERPGFQLMSLVSPGHEDSRKTLADVPCLLPDQMSIYLSTYIPLLLVSLLIVLGSNVLRVYRLPIKHSRRLSSPNPSRRRDDESEDRWNEMTLLPQPVSSIRSPKSGLKPQIPPSFVLIGRWHRIMCCDSLRRCLTLCCTSRRLNFEGLWIGFLRDTRDIAVFPLTLFATISFWITLV